MYVCVHRPASAFWISLIKKPCWNPKDQHTSAHNENRVAIAQTLFILSRKNKQMKQTFAIIAKSDVQHLIPNLADFDY